MRRAPSLAGFPPRFFACAATPLVLVSAALLAGCSDDGDGGTGAGAASGATGASSSAGAGGSSPGACIAPSADDQTVVQTAFIEAAPGSTICFTEGTFSFTTELQLDVDGVTVQGAGQGKTVFDFGEQDVGANGLLVRGDGTVLEGFDVKNTPGDGIRADAVDGVTFRNVSVLWDADASLENGAYGLYPVGSKNVVIDGCEVKGARDAGIYVGQSRNILVMNSEAWGNVAGIEIENSTDAEVTGNHAHDNTGGILIFNLPGLPVKDGKRTKVHDNRIENNNLENFAEKGTTVARVPRGTGMILLATDDNEVHDNEIAGNDSAGIFVLSYLPVLFGPYEDPEFDPYPQGNFIHDNQFQNNGGNPAPLVKQAISVEPVPDIAWDGCIDPEAEDDGHLVNCLDDNQGTYINFNFCGDFPEQTLDRADVTCTYDPLPEQGE